MGKHTNLNVYPIFRATIKNAVGKVHQFFFVIFSPFIQEKVDSKEHLLDMQ